MRFEVKAIPAIYGVRVRIRTRETGRNVEGRTLQEVLSDPDFPRFELRGLDAKGAAYVYIPFPRDIAEFPFDFGGPMDGARIRTWDIRDLPEADFVSLAPKTGPGSDDVWEVVAGEGV